MPPKTKISADMVIDAAFEIVRESGIESVSARAISAKLHCSTQPVLYCFETIEDIRKETYKRADQFHGQYIMNVQGDNPMLEIGVSYVRFAVEERYLFRFLFQSDRVSKQSLIDMVNDDALKPLHSMLAETMGIGVGQAKEEFISRFLVVHGMASLLANNSMEYNEQVIMNILNKTFSD